MKILVTGGLGFIGSHFARTALEKGHAVSVLDKLTYAGHRENIANIANELEDIRILDIATEETTQYLSKRKFDLVVNFAAESHVDRSIRGGMDFVASNVMGVVNLLESQKRGSFQKFIQISTDEVYGSISEGSWDEKAPLLPRSPYSASKASAELHCQAYGTTFNLPISITRCANNFGPFQSVEKLIPVAISRILKGEKVPVYGDGMNVREWIHVQDHVDAVFKVIELDRGGIFNIGGEPTTNLEIVKKILQIMGRSEDQLVFVEDRLGHDFRYSVNDNLLREVSGWSPSKDLNQGLIDTISWYQENVDWVSMSESKINS